MAPWLWILFGLPWVGCAAVVSLRGRGKGFSGPLSLAVVVASCVALFLARLGGDSGRVAAATANWIPTMEINLSLRLDALAFPFLLNTLGVAVMATWYAIGYLRHTHDVELCYGLMLAFVGSMVGVLLSEDILLFFVFWEAMLVTSGLLLVGWGEGERTPAVTLKYFIYTQAGSLLLLAAVAWLLATTGTSHLGLMAERLSGLPPERVLWVAVVMCLGFGVKLAIAPLHTWLPDAHSIAPMPVTVLLAAAMLSMGAYGILRFPVSLFGLTTMQRLQLPLLIIAFVSQVYGALMCLTCRDIKRIIAYSSVSQMGYVLFGIATLTPQGVEGAMFQVINHGILKALLFMIVGIVIHATGRRQIGELGGLSTRLPAVTACLFVAALSMAGLPPFSGFHSEWLILAGGMQTAYPILRYADFGVPLLTACYVLWFATRLTLGTPPEDMRVADVRPAMRWPVYVLSGITLVVGLFPSPVYVWMEDLVAGLRVAGAL